MQNNETLETIFRRRSVRNFSREPVTDAELDLILQAGLCAPNGSGSIEENAHFAVVQNPGLLEKINALAREAARQSGVEHLARLGGDPGFNCLYNAPAFILVSYNAATVCPEVDAAAITENMLLAAESLRLGGCWLYFPLQAFAGGGGEDLRRELAIPDGFKPCSSLVVGRRLTPAAAGPERLPRHITRIK